MAMNTENIECALQTLMASGKLRDSEITSVLSFHSDFLLLLFFFLFLLFFFFSSGKSVADLGLISH
jgi:hypothetical protein